MLVLASQEAVVDFVESLRKVHDEDICLLALVKDDFSEDLHSDFAMH